MEGMRPTHIETYRQNRVGRSRVDNMALVALVCQRLDGCDKTCSQHRPCGAIRERSRDCVAGGDTTSRDDRHQGSFGHDLG